MVLLILWVRNTFKTRRLEMFAPFCMQKHNLSRKIKCYYYSINGVDTIVLDIPGIGLNPGKVLEFSM